MSIQRILWEFSIFVIIITPQSGRVAGADNGKVKQWSNEFLTLLNVETSVADGTLEESLQPILKLVRNIKDDPDFLPWLRYLGRLTVTASGQSLDLSATPRTPLNFLLILAQQLLSDNNIQKTRNLLNHERAPLSDFPSEAETYLKQGQVRERSLSTFFKRLYNAKRKQGTVFVGAIPVEAVAMTEEVTTQTVIESFSSSPEAVHKLTEKSEQFGSSSPSQANFEALRGVLNDLLNVLKKDQLLDQISPDFSNHENISATTEKPSTSTTSKTTSTSTTTDPTTTSSTTTTTLATTTTDVPITTLQTTLSIEDRIAALFPSRSSTTMSPVSFKPKVTFRPKFIRTRTTTPPSTTTPYQKYPTTRSTSPPITTTTNRIWLESELTECQSGKTCHFRGRITVSGFNAELSREWRKISKKLRALLVPKFRRIFFDSNLGAKQNHFNVIEVIPTSRFSAEFTIDVVIVELEFNVSSKMVVEAFNEASDRLLTPYRLERSLTEFHLDHPDIRSQDHVVASAFISTFGQSVSNVTVGIILGVVILAGSFIIWFTTCSVKMMRARSMRRKVKDTTPILYSEVEAAVSSLKKNNVYAPKSKKQVAAKKKKRVSIFDLEREKERQLDKSLEDVNQKADKKSKKKKVSHGISEIFLIDSSSPGSPILSSSFKKQPQYGPVFKSQDVEESPLDSSALFLSPRLLPQRSSFRIFTQNLRLRHKRVRVRSRPTLHGVFNPAFVADEMIEETTEEHVRDVEANTGGDAVALPDGFHDRPQAVVGSSLLPESTYNHPEYDRIELCPEVFTVVDNTPDFYLIDSRETVMGSDDDDDVAGHYVVQAEVHSHEPDDEVDDTLL